MNHTRVSLTTSSIIDHIATACARNISNSGVHKVSMSDHYWPFACSSSMVHYKMTAKLLKRDLCNTLTRMHFLSMLVIFVGKVLLAKQRM